MATDHDFPYTDRQRRWWFANLEESNPRAAAARGVEAMRSRITPSEPTPEQGRRLGSLVARKEAAIRAGTLSKQTIGWDPVGTRPWSVREPDGRLIKRFDTAEQARAFVLKLNGVRE
jgi:hypothetical protein